MKKLWRHNGLSIVLLSLFAALLGGQSFVGHRHHNNELMEHGQPVETYLDYLTGSHFLEATMENWESEFFQMGIYVLFTVSLFQKGSSESKDPDKEEEEVDQDPREAPLRPETPLPVRKGGLWLRLYEHSLSLAFILLFLAAFFLHANRPRLRICLDN